MLLKHDNFIRNLVYEKPILTLQSINKGQFKKPHKKQFLFLVFFFLNNFLSLGMLSGLDSISWMLECLEEMCSKIVLIGQTTHKLRSDEKWSMHSSNIWAILDFEALQVS